MPRASEYITDLMKLRLKDVKTLFLLLKSKVKGEQDDNNFLLENLIKLLAKLNKGSLIGEKLTNEFISTLWNALEHPQPSSLGTQYRYRTADGGFNNIRMPDLGRAGTPYVRIAKPVKLQNIALPDPATIFDSILGREDTFDSHPNKISSMLFYLASIIIHDIFRTDHHDFTISNASSYLDLGPLYGNNQQEQDSVRTFRDGKLKPDCFSEKRVLGFPPGVGVMLIMFNRFHNYVVTQLAAINENGRFSKPSDSNATDAWVKYDNDLFQTGRLINCGLYVNCVLKDYVRTILNLNRTDSKWNLDPRSEEGKGLFDAQAAEGIGNQVAAEFNVIYRWHSAISERDDQWTQNLYSGLFPGKKSDEVTLKEFLETLTKYEEKLPDDPLERKFANLTRSSDGTYSDSDLVRILEDSICDVAGSFGANTVPKILRSVVILGIVQSRAWNMASLNEFREASGLSRHKTFKDINPDPIVAMKLRNLYGHPDCVELYAGLIAEKPKPPITPGSGLCVNFTTSYSILSDAVSLVRGDRFFTIDYTAKNLTNWGFKEVESDISINEGCVLFKLILRAFPHHFKNNSIFAHFPFVIPDENLKIQKTLRREDKYSWDKPVRETVPVIVKSYATAQSILNDQTNWRYIGDQNMSVLTSDSGNNVHLKDLEAEVKRFYQTNMVKLLDKHSYGVPGKKVNEVDIVRDVSNLVNAHFAACVFNLSIKTEEWSCGTFTDQEIYEDLAVLYQNSVYSHDVAKGFELHQAARNSTHKLGKFITKQTDQIASRGLIAQVKKKLHKSAFIPQLGSLGTALIREMLEANFTTHNIVWNHILPTAASMTVGASQVFCQALDFYLGDGAKFLPDLLACSLANTQEADKKIERYFLEGARLSSTSCVYRVYQPQNDVTNSMTTIQDFENTHTIHAGECVLIDIYAASRDPNAFPNPDEVILTRQLDTYLHYGFGPYRYANSRDLSIVAMAAMFKSVFRLKGIRRAQASSTGESWIWGESQGVMKKVEMLPSPPGHFSSFMTPDQSSFSPFPTTLKIHWDRE